MDIKSKLIIFILDRSGSMRNLQKDTIEGFNSLIEKQKIEKSETTITTVLFDHEYKLIHENIDIKEVKLLTDHDYYARGTTSLYDAIGITINKVGAYLNSLEESKRPGQVRVVIITDGEENSSREFNKDQIKEMISHQTEKYNWEFIYLGANVDAFKNASSINIGTYSNYTASDIGTKSVYTTMSSVINKEGTINNSDLDGIL